MMENNTITIPMDEYKELLRKAVCFDILRETASKSSYHSDVENALFRFDEEVKNDDTV